MADRDSQDDLPTDAGVSLAGPVAHGGDEELGRTIAGYKVEALIARGGMGVVYRAVHLHLRRVAALKLLAPEIARRADFRERFIRESRLAASIDHPHIVTIYDAGESEGRLYIAMQYVRGRDLGRVLGAGALEPDRAVAVVEQIAAALDAAHARGLVHRDVKPANVLMEGEHCYLSDFGVTKVVGEPSTLTGRGDFVGTIDYLAPEQVENVDVDSRADVYALGCVLHHCLSGSRPYSGKDSDLQVVQAHLHDPPPSLPAPVAGRYPGLDDVVRRAMAKDPAERYASAGEVAGAARAAVGSPAGAQAQPGPGTAWSVLLAAGDGVAAAPIRAVLASDSFRVVATVADAEAAAESLRGAAFDLVVVDSSFGERAAEALLAALGEESRPPVLAVTDAGERAPAGSDDVVVRPFSALQVLTSARRLVERVSG